MSGIKWNDDYSWWRGNGGLVIMLVVCMACMAGIIVWFFKEAY